MNTVKVETKEVTQTVVTVTMDGDTASQLEAVLRLVRFYNYEGDAIVGRDGLETIYNNLVRGYAIAIEGGEIVLEKY